MNIPTYNSQSHPFILSQNKLNPFQHILIKRLRTRQFMKRPENMRQARVSVNLRLHTRLLQLAIHDDSIIAHWAQTACNGIRRWEVFQIRCKGRTVAKS
jgi:hypothetical protein